LLDEYNKPSETDVNVSIYDAKTGLMKYSFYHTLNAAGFPDTLFIDCIPTYNIIAHTIPPVEKKDVKLSPAIHNIIPLNTPQGTLTLKITGLTNYLRLQAVIKSAGSDKIIHVQDITSSQKYITGKYDIEILSLPRITLKNIEIRQNTTTTLEIPQPGKLTIITSQPIIGAIFQLRDNKLEWLCDMDPNLRAQNIIIQPGLYYIYYKRKGNMSTYYTSETEFKITSGGSTTVNVK
jgi:Ca-activated chloride channel homolog